MKWKGKKEKWEIILATPIVHFSLFSLRLLKGGKEEKKT